MSESTVTLSVPAEAPFARTVRMMASNVAVVSGMNVDDVEDVRMAAEEGFIWACATAPETCTISVTIDDGSVSFDFSLGDADPAASEEGESLDLARLLLSAICDEFSVSDDGRTLHLAKSGGAHDER